MAAVAPGPVRLPPAPSHCASLQGSAHLRGAALRLCQLVAAQLATRGIAPDARLPAICGLFKDRCDTTVVLADWAARFYQDVVPDADEFARHVTDAVRPAIAQLAQALEACAWDKAAIATAIKDTLAATGLKMPQLAMPVRVLVLGTAQTPSLDAVLALIPRKEVVGRLSSS